MFDTSLPTRSLSLLACAALLLVGMPACDSDGSGGEGEEEDTTAPAAPSGLTGASQDGAVALEWSAPSDDDVDGYRVYRSTSSFSDKGAATLVSGDGLVSGLSYTDESVENGTAYYYRITAVDEAGNESSPSGEQSATPADATPPGAPSGLEGTSEAGAVALTWSAPGDEDVAGYNVYRSESSFSEVGSADRVNSDAPVSEPSFSDDGAENGTTYYYRVAAVDEAGNESDLSGETQKTPFPDPPGNP